LEEFEEFDLEESGVEDCDAEPLLAPEICPTDCDGPELREKPTALKDGPALNTVWVPSRSVMTMKEWFPPASIGLYFTSMVTWPLLSIDVSGLFLTYE